MNEIKYEIKVKTPIRHLYIRCLYPLDFISIGIPINFFKEKKVIADRFARLEQQFQTESIEKQLLTKEQSEIIEKVLKMGIKNYNNIKNKLLEFERIYIYNTIIFYSCNRFYDSVETDKNITLICHQLAKNYGGDPWSYLEMPLDRFLFNLHALNVGVTDENAQIKKVMAKK